MLWFLLNPFQIGKEHVGLKAVTEILQDIQYKVSHNLEYVELLVMHRVPKTIAMCDNSQKDSQDSEKLFYLCLGFISVQDA